MIKNLPKTKDLIQDKKGMMIEWQERQIANYV